jgi:hypothetical protein
MQQMNATHPFLDKAYLWFSPRDFFFMGKIPDKRLWLRWERSSRIRKVAPISRIIDPDSPVPPKKVPINPLYLPSVRTIVRTLCPGMSQLPGPVPPPAPARPVQPDREEGNSNGGNAVASSTSNRVQVEEFEEIIIGDDVEIDWDWWGSSTSNSVRYIHRLRSDRIGTTADGEAEGEPTVVGDTKPQLLSPTPAPPPITPQSINSRYHPCKVHSPYIYPNAISHGPPDRFTPPPTGPFKKFKPPARYAKGTLNPDISPSDTHDTPVSSFVSASTTVVNPATPTPPSTSESTYFSFTDESEKVADPQEQGISSQDEPAHPQKLSQETLERIVRILREDGHDQSGVWALLSPELYDARGDLAAELSVPILDLERQTFHRISSLLRQDGFSRNGILILNIYDPNDHERRDICDQTVKNDILAWI